MQQAAVPIVSVIHNRKERITPMVRHTATSDNEQECAFIDTYYEDEKEYIK